MNCLLNLREPRMPIIVNHNNATQTENGLRQCNVVKHNFCEVAAIDMHEPAALHQVPLVSRQVKGTGCDEIEINSRRMFSQVPTRCFHGTFATCIQILSLAGFKQIYTDSSFVLSLHQSQKDQGATMVYPNFAQRSLKIVRHVEIVQVHEDVEQCLVYSPTLNIIEAAGSISL
jgi:hypothetical protein